MGHEMEVLITEQEREQCRKVMKAFEELYEIADMIVVEAGRYGFVKLQYFNKVSGFDEAVSIFDSQELFDELWEEWYDAYLLNFYEGTKLADLSYEEMYDALPDVHKAEIAQKKVEFAKMSEIKL